MSKKNLTPESATFWDRAAAWSIDFMLFQLLSTVAAGILGIRDFTGLALVAFIFFLLYIIYNTLMEMFLGGGLGKFLLGITVLDAQHDLVSFPRVLLRQCASAVSWITLNVGHVLALVRKDRKMLHDMLSGTEVVFGRGGWPWELSPDIHRGIKIAVLILMGLVSLWLVYRSVQMGVMMGQQMQAQMGVY